MKEKQVKLETIGGRIYGLKNLNVVVAQYHALMIVQSRHSSLSAAQKEAEKLAKGAETAIFAALELAGNPHHDYQKGDVLDPEDVWWSNRRVDNCCSECCRHYRPTNLEYRCPITRYTQVCDTVAALRILPGKAKP